MVWTSSLPRRRDPWRLPCGEARGETRGEARGEGRGEGSRWMGYSGGSGSSPSRRREPWRLPRGEWRGECRGEARAELLRRVRTPGGRSGAGPSGMVASQEARRHKALARSFSSIPSATAGSESEGPDGQVPPGPAEPRRCTPVPAPVPAPDPDPSSMVMGGLLLPHPPRPPPLAASQPHSDALRQSPRGRAARVPPLIQGAAGTLRGGGVEWRREGGATLGACGSKGSVMAEVMALTQVAGPPGASGESLRAAVLVTAQHTASSRTPHGRPHPPPHLYKAPRRPRRRRPLEGHPPGACLHLSSGPPTPQTPS